MCYIIIRVGFDPLNLFISPSSLKVCRPLFTTVQYFGTTNEFRHLTGGCYISSDAFTTVKRFEPCTEPSSKYVKTQEFGGETA